MDLVAITGLQADGLPRGAVVYHGTVNGSFEEAQVLDVGPVNTLTFSPDTFAIADLNQDNVLDLALPDLDQNALILLIGTGDGLFSEPVSLPTAQGSLGIQAADLNGDTNTDLVTLDTNFNSISVLLGNGDATFGPPQEFALSAPTALKIVDLNQDSALDIVSANGNNTLSIFIGNGQGAFQETSIPCGGQPSRVEISDFTGDGNPDITLTGPGRVELFIGNGDGSLQPPQTVYADASAGFIALRAGDLNGDGFQDLAVSDTGASTIVPLFGSSSGLEAAEPTPVGGLSVFVDVVDIAGGQTPDIITLSFFDNEMSLLIGDQSNFVQESFTVSDGPIDAVVRDFNKDSAPDILVVGFDSLSVLLGAPD